MLQLHAFLLAALIACLGPRTTQALQLCELATYPNGTFYIANPNSLQCRICGYIFGSEPIRCYAFNDTFDGTTPGAKIKEPSRAHWTGLSAAAPDAANPIQPTSHMRYAVTSTSGYATMDFTAPTTKALKGIDWWTFGTLKTFDFACANASTVGGSYVNEAVPCTLNVTSTCAGTDYEDDGPYVYSETFGYEPVGSPYAGMMGATWTANGSDFGDEICGNYTFQAVASDGSDALLYLDNVLYIGWWNWE